MWITKFHYCYVFSSCCFLIMKMAVFNLLVISFISIHLCYDSYTMHNNQPFQTKYLIFGPLKFNRNMLHLRQNFGEKIMLLRTWLKSFTFTQINLCKNPGDIQSIQKLMKYFVHERINIMHQWKFCNCREIFIKIILNIYMYILKKYQLSSSIFKMQFNQNMTGKKRPSKIF